MKSEKKESLCILL